MSNLLDDDLKVINIGLKQFFDALVDQGNKPIHYEWRPPADDEEEIADIMALLL